MHGARAGREAGGPVRSLDNGPGARWRPAQAVAAGDEGGQTRDFKEADGLPMTCTTCISLEGSALVK